jgi:hypothetical protein
LPNHFFSRFAHIGFIQEKDTQQQITKGVEQLTLSLDTLTSI